MGEERKIWEVIKPFIIYYMVYRAAFFLMAVLLHIQTMTVLVNCMVRMIAIVPLIPMLKKELTMSNEAINTLSLFLTVILAASISVGLNILMSLTGFLQISETYQNVADRQYGVSFGAGIILYGLVSPITEEIVFRGLVFNRMRRFYPTAAAILISGMLFGVYHGNPVQGIYGACLGILIAYIYEKMHNFIIPCLFHAAANLVVYSLTQNGAVQNTLFTVPGCIILLFISACCIVIIRQMQMKQKYKSQ